VQLNPQQASTADIADFAPRVIAWQRQHGRHDLPWQQNPDPYCVWLSEIMLQQTQVATVLAYYQRFLQTFPTVADLAAAAPDAVMQLWAGLGYYSRARNLHRAAQMVVAEFAGQFPQSAADLQRLPGVGASTAAAIAAFCFAQRIAIFDANVQRVLARYWGYTQDLAKNAHKKQLWAFAHDLLPAQNLAQTMPAYTQGVMDLGATVCNARKPNCTACPLASGCVALAQGNARALPIISKKLQRREQPMYLLWQQNGELLRLARRPSAGIWGGLYCLPEISLAQYQQLCADNQNLALQPIKHMLTHRDLQLHIVRQRNVGVAAIATDEIWQALAALPQLGLPQPISKLFGASHVNPPTKSIASTN
jgi:A/G-specific adenine glycosylase